MPIRTGVIKEGDERPVVLNSVTNDVLGHKLGKRDPVNGGLYSTCFSERDYPYN